MADVTRVEPPAGWNKSCCEEHLAEIALWIPEWREVSPFLGLTKADECEILGSALHSVRKQKIEMLRMWKEKRGGKATYKRLCRVFTKCDMLDLEEKVQKLLAAKSISSSDEEDSSSASPQPDPLTSYASYLKELYTSISSSHTSQHWTHLPRCEFIQLAMIEDEEVRRGGPEEEMIRLAQQGKIETILDCHKRSINLAELLPFPPSSPQPLVVLPPPPPGRLCLIEGAPGGGKSTLVLHICHQWAQGASWLSGFDVVVLAYLRDQEVQNAKTLADILPAASNTSVCASIMQASYGKQVLFIFDGWDEFPHHLMNDSLVSTIIRQPHKLSLHQSTILVTSRPMSSGNLFHIADRRVEILGFTQHQIREYIEKALDGNSARIQKLVQHLDEHPVIEGYCYVPLHVAILVHIFLTMNGALPTTLHELFCSLVLCSIIREQATHDPDTSLPELSSLDDLPDDLKSKLSNLSKLAYNGVMQDKVVFYSKDLRTVRLPINLPSLGLLQAVEGLALYSKSLSYNFLHLSVQELLAAYFISQMDSSYQVKVFKELFESSRFQAVLHYYCGFTKLNNREIRKFIFCYQTSKSDFKELLPLLHCFFEAQEPSLCQLVDAKFIPSEHHELSTTNFSPVDFIAIGYFITSLLSRSATATCNTPKVHLAIRHIDDHCLKLLLSELSKYPVGGLPTAGVLSGKQLALQLNTPYITDQGAELIASCLKKFSLISELTICNYEIQHCKYDRANALLTSSSYSDVASSSGSPGNMAQLQGWWSHSPWSAIVPEEPVDIHPNRHSLEPLSLESHTLWSRSDSPYDHVDEVNLGISFSTLLNNIFVGLQHNTTLVYLSLIDTGTTAIDPDTARSLTKMLQVNRSLTHLDLSNNQAISDTGVRCIFEGLQHNTTLVYLNLSNTGITATDADTAKSLTKMLRVNKTLKHLDFSNNDTNMMSDSGTRCIFEGLQQGNTLVYLSLSNAGITATNADTAKSLTKMLQVNRSLTHLDLSNNQAISDTGICCIFEGLQHNTTLVYLNLSNTVITDTDTDTAKSLAKMLQVNKTLKHLDFSNNETMISGSSGTRCIFEGLQHNTSLVYLNLSNTGIKTIDAVTARSLTKMLQENKSLVYLDLSNRATNVQIDLQRLEQNTTQLELSLCGICITDDAAALIGQILISNCSLQILNINGCFLGINGIYYILDALKCSTCTSLKRLYFSQHLILMEPICNEIQTTRKEKGLSPIEIITWKYRNESYSTAAVVL